MVDEHLLDPDFPESLVYRVNGEGRTLVGAMFMAPEGAADDPLLVEYGGPLMTWHVHTELCFREGEPGAPRQIAGRIDAEGNCPAGSVQRSSQRPMLHVWIVARECGPFSELNRIDPQTPAPASEATTDECAHEHGDAAAPG
jgi:hypothetical protein